MSRTKAPLEAFTGSALERVLLHPEHDQFAYSDGKEVEDRILETLKTTADLSVGSPELMATIEDWPTEYHFTDTRANLIRHLPLTPGLRVLELGAGCGAITRFLGECGCDVVAVEGSLVRARCTRERARDLENVSVYCANFQDIAFNRDFDVVTLIGVLEYAPKFFMGDDPIRSCLDVARSALAPGGTLVIAIENQLGLKYFAGATEDHLGTHYSGIENHYVPDGVRTMGRQQIERALEASGFADVSFQYPFPDYKLPVAIVFEAALGRKDFRPSEIVRHLYARDYAGKDLRSFDASLVWPVLDDNGLLGHLSNSFLVLARERSSAQEVIDAAGREVLALAYSAGRARRFQTRTTFSVGAEGPIICEKRLVYPGEAVGQQPSPGMTHRLVRDVYLSGPTLHSAITAALRAGDPQLVIALMRKWLDFLGGVIGSGSARAWDNRLPGRFWDCTPANLIELHGELSYFDAEWVSDPGPTVRNLLMRYVFGLAFGAASAPYFESCFRTPPGPSVCSVLGELGMRLTEEDIKDFAKDTNEKNALIFPLKATLVLHPQDFFGVTGNAQPGPAQKLVMKIIRGISRGLTK
jgi:cyclopropane fatty-acyl-phospholipid synthase-like methyltransferase